MFKGRRLKVRYATILMGWWLLIAVVSACFNRMFSFGMFLVYLTCFVRYYKRYSIFSKYIKPIIEHTIHHFRVKHDFSVVLLRVRKAGLFIMIFALLAAPNGHWDLKVSALTTLTVKQNQVITKEYDNTVNYTLQKEDYVLQGVDPGDDVSLAATAAFNNENVYLANQVELTDLSLTGKDAGKYQLSVSSATFEGKLTPKPNVLRWNEQSEYEYTGRAQFISPMYYESLFWAQQGLVADSSLIPYEVYKGEERASFEKVGTYEFRVLMDEVQKDMNTFWDMENYDFSGSQFSKEYKIVGKSLEMSMVQGFNDRYEHTGGNFYTPFTLVSGDTTLRYGTDYTIHSSPDNSTAGQKTLTVTGIGAYEGSVLELNYEVYYAEYEGDLMPAEGRNENGFYHEDFTLDAGSDWLSATPDIISAKHTFTISEEGIDQPLTLYYIQASDHKILEVHLVYSLDKTKPELSGIQNDETYYVNQVVEVKDLAFDYFMINDKLVYADTFLIEIENESSYAYLYELRGVDKAGNESDVLIYKTKALRTILDSSLADYNVELNDKDIIEKAIDTYNKIDIEDASDQQIEELKKLKNKAQGMLNTIEEVLAMENTLKDVIVKEEYTSAEKEILRPVIDQYEALTGHQQSLINKDLFDKINKIINIIRTDHLVNFEYGFTVSGKYGTDFDADTVLMVEEVTSKVGQTVGTMINNSLLNNQEVKDIYDIHLLLDGKIVKPDGMVIVKIPLSKEQQEYQNLLLMHIGDDNRMQFVHYEREGDTLVFESSHFSYYAIIGNKSDTGEEKPINPNLNQPEAPDENQSPPQIPQEDSTPLSAAVKQETSGIADTGDFTALNLYIMLIGMSLLALVMIKKKKV
ncbi:MAG: YDG domain-containing protein [Beduini sp.]|uniref:YDG domain-containing protein n=1 Tax=Beduini sp. TaxID=1922300 RepID=UPI00399F8B3C